MKDLVVRSQWGLAKNHTKEEQAVANHGFTSNAIAIISVLALMVTGFSYAHTHHTVSKSTAQPKSEIVTNVKKPAIHKIVVTPKQRHGFINKVGYPAVQAFKDGHYQVLPSIVIAQAIVESNWGTSGLYAKGHNIFGVKGAYRGKSVNMATTEYVHGQKESVNANFRYYPSFEASILDHDQLLQNTFIKKGHDLNFRDVAYRIKANHYATDPTYPQKLINTIKTYHLYRYDKIGLR